MDEWIRYLTAEYPEKRVTSGHMTEQAFLNAITSDGRQPDLVFADMLEHLANQKRGYLWLLKRMIPRLDNWLRDGLWRQLHEVMPPTALVSEKNLQTMAAGDAFVKGGNHA